MLIILSKLAVALLLAVGPLFILLLIFNNTRQLFESWLKTLLNYAVIPIFVYTLLALLLALAESPLSYMEKNTGIYSQFITVIGPFLLVTFVATILLAQVMNVAASVTSGISLSTMGAAAGAWRTSRNASTSLAAGVWKSAPAAWQAAKYTGNKIKTGHAALKQSLNRKSEVISNVSS